MYALRLNLSKERASNNVLLLLVHLVLIKNEKRGQNLIILLSLAMKYTKLHWVVLYTTLLVFCHQLYNMPKVFFTFL